MIVPKKFFRYKTKLLGCPLVAQIFVQHTAGMYLFICGNHGDFRLFISFPDGLGRFDAGSTHT